MSEFLKSLRLFTAYCLYMLLSSIIADKLELPNGFGWLIFFMVINAESSVIERIKDENE